jgi:hypothetical protein
LLQGRFLEKRGERDCGTGPTGRTGISLKSGVSLFARDAAGAVKLALQKLLILWISKMKFGKGGDKNDDL